jgi:hypothetical protein
LASAIVCGVVGLSTPVALAQPFADGIAFFDNVFGPTSGEFGWDVFNGTGYVGPHTPDQFATGIGSANLTVNPGGFGPTSQGNLYSFNSIANWRFDLSGLEASDPFTSIAVQLAVTRSGPDVAITNFMLGLAQPDDFFRLTRDVQIGGFGAPAAVDYYWAEWNGLTAATDFTVLATGTGIHQSLVAAKFSYVNTSSASYNITAIPEPSSAALGFSLLSLLGLRRRRVRHSKLQSKLALLERGSK